MGTTRSNTGTVSSVVVVVVCTNGFGGAVVAVVVVVCTDGFGGAVGVGVESVEAICEGDIVGRTVPSRRGIRTESSIPGMNPSAAGGVKHNHAFSHLNTTRSVSPRSAPASV